MTDIFDDIKTVQKKLKPLHFGKVPEGMAGKYARAVRAADSPPDQTFFALNRTLPPAESITYGADTSVPPILPGPYGLSAPAMQNYGRHRPVWRGWRPERPTTTYPQLGVVMPQEDRTNKFEASIPTEAEIVNMAMRNAVAPYPTAPESQEIPDPYREYNIYVEPQGSLGYLGFLGNQAPSVPELIPGVTADKAVSVIDQLAKTVSDRYNVNPATGQVNTRPKPAIPWGTLAMVGGISLAAMFLLPKVLK